MAAASVTLRVERVNASPRIRIGACRKSRGAPARPGAPNVGGLEERPGCAGALRTLGGLEERPGCAGALRTLGGLGGHFGAPHVLDRQAELDEEAAPGRGDRADGPPVKLNGPMHGREAQADATRAA